METQELPLIFTDAAAIKVRELFDEEGDDALMLRVFISGGGCSGFQYGFTFDQNETDGDTIVVNQGVKGPLGFVGGVAAFLFGVSRLFSNIMIGILTIVAAVCLIKADSILQTFGMVI